MNRLMILVAIICGVFSLVSCKEQVKPKPLESVGLFRVRGEEPFTRTGFTLMPGTYYMFLHRGGGVCIQPDRRCGPPRGNDLPGHEAWGLFMEVGDDLVQVRDRLILNVESETPLVFYVPDGDELPFSESNLPLYEDNSGYWDIEVMTFDQAPDPGFMQGVSITSYSVDGYCSPELESMLKQLQSYGADAVQYVAVHKTDSKTIFPALFSPRAYCLVKATDTAHRLDLEVSWNLHVDPAGDGWRGALQPDDRAAFFAAYAETARFFAGLAEEHGVEYFIPATEMVSLMESEEDRNAWLSLFLDLHATYFGTIVYAADRTEYAYLGEDFWKSCCDAIGITPWYTLTSDPHPTEKQLADAWKPIVTEMEQFADKVKMRILLTEAPGYRAVEGCTLEPAVYLTKRAPSDLCQAEAYRAFLGAFKRDRRHFFGGYFLWEIAAPGETESAYSPLGRITEGVLKHAWKKMRTDEAGTVGAKIE